MDICYALLTKPKESRYITSPNVFGNSGTCSISFNIHVFLIQQTFIFFTSLVPYFNWLQLVTSFFLFHYSVSVCKLQHYFHAIHNDYTHDYNYNFCIIILFHKFAISSIIIKDCIIFNVKRRTFASTLYIQPLQFPINRNRSVRRTTLCEISP